MSIRLIRGDSRVVLPTLAENSVDAVVCDPPYELTSGKRGGTGAASLNTKSPAGRSRIGTGFMSLRWDATGIAHDPAFWAEVLRVLKPGGYLLAFGGSRTFHRLACAIEDAGFELRDAVLNLHEAETVEVAVRDCPWLLGWFTGEGFPKSLNIARAVDRALGAEGERGELKSDRHAAMVRTGRVGAGKTGGWASTSHTLDQIDATAREYLPATDEAKLWKGWGTQLKPSFEPIVMARKSHRGTVAQNVLMHGVGGLNIDGCRIPVEDEAYARNHSGDRGHAGTRSRDKLGSTDLSPGGGRASSLGRWPANTVHDGSASVVSMFPREAGAASPVGGKEPSQASTGRVTGERDRVPGAFHNDAGSAARFFWHPKASTSDRNDGLPPGRSNEHPTLKPTLLMRWLVRLVMPPARPGQPAPIVLDPFSGSGSTMKAAELEGFDGIGIEQEAEHVETARYRVGADSPLLAEVSVEVIE